MQKYKFRMKPNTDLICIQLNNFINLNNIDCYHSINSVKRTTEAAVWLPCRKDMSLCCYANWLTSVAYGKKCSFAFYVPILRLPLSFHFIPSHVPFRNLLYRVTSFPLDPANGFLRIVSVHFCKISSVSWIHTKPRNWKMCLRYPYLKTTFSAQWLVLVIRIPLQIQSNSLSTS